MKAEYGEAKIKSILLSRWWIKIRKCKPLQKGGALHEFYVPWWAWPAELLHRLIFGSTKFKE